MQRLFMTVNILNETLVALGFTRRRNLLSPRNRFFWFSVAGVSVAWLIGKFFSENICGTLASNRTGCFLRTATFFCRDICLGLSGNE